MACRMFFQSIAIIIINFSKIGRMEKGKAKTTLQEKYIGKWVRVATKNQRSFEGKLMCVDYKSNLILHEAVAEIHPSHNCPLNYQLENIYDQKLQYTAPEGLSPEEIAKDRREYFGNHYYFGAIMVTGADILSIELSDRLPPHLQPKVEQAANGSDA